MSNVCKNEGEIDNVLEEECVDGCNILDKSEIRLRVFDSSHNISEILKFIPFYERLMLRVVNSKWNLSFYFSGCWETLDYRFYDLKKHEFYLKHLKRFIASIKKLEICIDQISDLNNLLRSIESDDLCSQCVDLRDDCKLDKISNCSIETPDFIETDNESNYDDNLNYNNHSTDNQSSNYFSDLNFDNSCLNEDHENNLNPEETENSTLSSGFDDSCSIDDCVDQLKTLLLSLKNLNNLYISDRLRKHNVIYARISPVILEFIESKCFPINSLKDLTKNSPSFSNSFNLTNLILDCPVNLNFILELVPLIRNVRNLVISRIVQEDSDLSICSVISELLEQIPKSQLESIQIGKSVQTVKSLKNPSFSSEARARHINRLSLASNLFHTSGDSEEGDELVFLLLSNHSNSLKIIILEDIEISFSAFNKIRNLKSVLAEFIVF
ncbi:uncharacterized protein TA05435 [Theileria annulata]|uniref:F-box domain-containing protein n=1 Tax=Theileria annulata TaxID=5874 RepID=Q4UCR7_THEAN|nr:uncharacterized protein TA05435 [Theileria annulata]CAI75384.1 hypothetical protein TA05435 [Theileria annulata]|eukprot:XP_954860.1 hypothetical protein TA05435 [Theileria annulata]